MSDFDDLIRGKLAAAQHEGRPDWDALAEQLDGEAFDDSLRQALPLAGLSTAAMPGATAPDWGGLLDRLDADADAEGDAFDRLISRRLAEVETDLAPADSWRQLSHRIDTLWPLRKAFIRYRVLEIAAAAALILTFVPMLRDNPIWRRGEVESVADAAAPPAGSAADADATAATYSPLDNLAQAFGLSSLADRIASPDQIAALYTSPTTSVAGGGGSAALGARQLPSVTLEPEGPLQVQVEPVAAYAPDAPNALNAQRNVRALPEPTLAAMPFTPPKLVVAAGPATAKRWSFGASGVYKTWQVFTPADESFDRGSSRQQVVAPQIGAHVLYAVGSRWRLGLNVGVSSATYGAGLPEVLRLNASTTSRLDVSEKFRSIDLDIAQATVDARYGLLDRRRPAQVWLKAGVGANAFLRTRYDVRRTLGDQNATPPPPREDDGPDDFSAREAKPIAKPFTPSQVKAFPNGLAQGGKLTETIQPFGRLGVEAEVKLGDRLRAFGSVDVDFATPGQRGFGPNQDRFGAVGLEFGARVSL